MRVAVIGSRNVPEGITLEKIIQRIPLNTSEIVSGGAEGIDTLAKEAAQKLHIPIIEFFPDYQKYGRHAPLKRDTQIVEYADYVVAFWDSVSRGTSYTISECIRCRVPFRIYPFTMMD